MKIINSLLTISLFALGTACNKKQQQTENVPTPEGAPVETKEPNTAYKSAFSGQTRIQGVKTKTPYESKILTEDLKKPWGIAPLPDGRLLITQKKGTLRMADASGKLSEEITGIPEVNDSGQGGLLGITIDPDFSKNRMVYWTFSEKNKRRKLNRCSQRPFGGQ
eukprot:Opistho-1_new@60170